MAGKFDVITVGSATVDVFAKTQSDLITITTRTTEEELICYPSGTKILIKDLRFMTGGGGTNTAVSFSRLGLKTAYLGNVGNDENGHKIISQLKKEKVGFIGTKGREMTNYSVVLDSIKHDRTILAYKEASENIQFEKINKKKLSTKWFYFSAMLGKAFKTQEKLAEYAEKNNIKIAFNPSNYLAEKGPKYLKKILSRTELLVLNREEAALLCRRRKEEPVKELLRTISSFGPNIVVITEGNKEVSCLYEGSVYTATPHGVAPLETTGAGDAFASSFLGGLIRKGDISFALSIGITNAESVISCYGAKNDLLTWGRASRKIKANPVKIKKSGL